MQNDAELQARAAQRQPGHVQADLRSQTDVSAPTPESVVGNRAQINPQARIEGEVSATTNVEGEQRLRDAQRAQSAGAAEVRSSANVGDRISTEQTRGENLAHGQVGPAAEVRATVNDPTGAAEASVTTSARASASEHGLGRAQSDVAQARGVVNDPAAAATGEASARATAKENEVKAGVQADVGISGSVNVDVDPTKK
ncbi:MAG: hypothetical protein KF773_22480 [Deltaproteobacteria bacterium]|nr:hypothetical protein [Deltaproteobacteria bacterium]